VVVDSGCDIWFVSVVGGLCRWVVKKREEGFYWIRESGDPRGSALLRSARPGADLRGAMPRQRKVRKN